jgi:hypothetical protein
MTDFIITPDPLEITLQVISPEILHNVGLTTPILKAVGPDEAAFEACEFLIKIHPEIYKEERLSFEMSPAAVRRYRLFLRSIDAVMCEFRVLLQNLITLLDPFETPYPILPRLAPMVGVDFNFDVPEEFARREIANAIFLWKRKGTRDNITDWIGFITGFRSFIREFYKEVIRTSVYGQAYAETPSTITNRGGTTYATLPHLDEHHRTSTWAGNNFRRPFFNFRFQPDTNYGTHGFTQTRGDAPDNGATLPGFLFRNHVGVYIDVPDDEIERTWFGQPFLNLIIDKLERILDIICLFGVIKHLFWRLITDENADLCEEITFTVAPRFAEGWNDVLTLGGSFQQIETISCNGVEEECISCIGDTFALDIDGDLCNTEFDSTGTLINESEGRLATFVLCTSDPNRVTSDAFADSDGGPWLTWHYTRYWSEWIGDTLETWIPIVGGFLASSISIPPELSVGEIFINPIIGTGTGQGKELPTDISQFVIDTCETGRFEDNILDFVEEWDSAFQDNIEFLDDWDVPPLFADVTEHEDDWELPEFIDNTELTDDWEITEVFDETTEFADIWDFFEVFDDNQEFFDNWEEQIPLTIPGPGAWYEGDDGPTGNSPVSLWVEKFNTPVGLDAVQSTVAFQPDVDNVDPNFNNFGSVFFDGFNDFMTVADDPTFNTDQFTIFTVFQWSNVQALDTIISKTTNATLSDGWGLVATGDSDSLGNTLRFFVDGYTSNFVETQIPDDTPVILCARYDQVELELVINGTVVGTFPYGGGVTNSAFDLFFAAHRNPSTGSGASGFFQGDIAEIIWYGRDLLDSEKVILLSYLAAKYNIEVDFTQLEISEPWEFEQTYDETPEVTEPFNFDVTYAQFPELFEPFNFDIVYIETPEVDNEPWDELGLPEIPVLEAFEDWDPDLPDSPVLEAFEDWDSVPITDPGDLEYTEGWEQQEVTDPGDLEYTEDWEQQEITDPGDLEYTEDWEQQEITDPGDLEYTEDWEQQEITDPGDLEYTEDWESPAIEDPGTLQYTEDWEANVISDPGTLEYEEGWEGNAIIIDESWDFPPDGTPTEELFETWEMPADGAQTEELFEEWEMPGAGSPTEELFEDWEFPSIGGEFPDMWLESGDLG